MVSALLGKKLGMTQIFSEDGKFIPVTLIQAGPCPILQVKTKDSDGYTALQLGFDEKKIKPEKLAEVTYVDVVGTTKGRGFTGVMKRHGFKGGKATHGQHNRDRHGGAIGQASDPGRVFKGMKMPGRYGNERVTVQNLQLVKIDTEKNIVAVKGAIPGHNGSYDVIKKALKKACAPAVINQVNRTAVSLRRER